MDSILELLNFMLSNFLINVLRKKKHFSEKTFLRNGKIERLLYNEMRITVTHSQEIVLPTQFTCLNQKTRKTNKSAFPFEFDFFTAQLFCDN